MNDLFVHILLFSIVGLAIVSLGSFFGDTADRPALGSIPRRLVMFFAGCAFVALILLVLEHTVASVR
jgi:hypothetical protein